MGYFLLDNPPASRQFYPSRNAALTGGVVIHTTEGVGSTESAEATARYISTRSNAGSYHCIVDWDSTILLVPDDYTAFSVASAGFNSRTWNIAFACRKDELAVDDFYTAVMFDRAGKAIVEFWQRNGFDPVASNDWIGTDVLTRAGLCQHGEAQPRDRSDAFVGHPQQFGLGIMLNDAIARYAGGIAPAPPPEPVPAPLPDLGPVFDAINAAKGQVLRRGSRGDAVKWLQTFLNAKTNAGLAVDGVFGAGTDAAVRRFQSDVRGFFNTPLAVDGVVGPRTWFWLTV